MLEESSSPQARNTAILPLASPGRLDLANCVAGSTAGAPGPPRPPPPRPAPPPPSCRAPAPGAAPPRAGPLAPLPSPAGRPQFVLRLAVAASAAAALP